MSKAIIKTIKDNNYNIVAMRLWVFGYPEALETLFTLPGWPDAMRSDSLNTKDGRWNKMPIEAFWSRDVASELTVTDVCEALNILRQHNCGYFALFNQEAARAGDTSCTVMAWLASPGAPPMVAGPYHEKWPQLVKQLIQTQTHVSCVVSFSLYPPLHRLLHLNSASLTPQSIVKPYELLTHPFVVFDEDLLDLH